MKRERIFVIIFCIILILPLIFSDKVGGSVSEDENRYLAPFPQLRLHSGLKTEIENWINDNAGGRELFRTAYNDININVLKTPRDDSNFYTDDGWIFLMNEDVLKYVQHTDAMSEEQQNLFIKNYNAIREKLAQKGIAMCSSIFPQKAELYPEKLNDYILPVFPVSQLEILENISNENPDMNLNVVYDEFQSEKSQGKELYSKSYDFSHWNNQGAFFGYKSMMAGIQKEIPSVRILSEADMQIDEVTLTKKCNNKIYEEPDLTYQVKTPHAAEDAGWFDALGYQSSDPWHSYRYYRNEDASLPKTLIIGDSYIWMFMMPWLAESFSETVFIHSLDTANINLMIDTIHPDIVVFAGLQNDVTFSIDQGASSLP